MHRLIHAEKANYPIVLLCRVLHVARSSYYAWREGEAARRARQAADDALAHEITVLHIASRKTYGVPRIHAELRRLGRRVNRKRIARVMRERDIRGVTRRKHRSLTRPDAKAKPAPDLTGHDFHAERPGTKLVGNITYLPTAEGWLHLACWLDLATREVVGARTSADLAALTGSGQALVGADDDEFTDELGQGREDVEDESAAGGWWCPGSRAAR
ncbi:IS3 family transposase [Streptomyces sp. NPDC018964]|uniref:IS3 family transposase n=1 Tax=unclassified Streptomyces TaxID=2593676 RepID=UPI0037A8825C